MKKLPESEWSYIVSVDDIGNSPAHYTLSADEDACAALAERFDLIQIKSLSARVIITREQGGRVIRVSGDISGDVIQECVVTLEPMDAHVADTFETFFADPEQAISFARARADMRAKQGGLEVEMIDEQDAPEEIVNGAIDLGEVAAQFFSLALDPYPRSMHAPDYLEPEETSDTDGEIHPFAALKEWKDKLK